MHVGDGKSCRVLSSFGAIAMIQINHLTVYSRQGTLDIRKRGILIKQFVRPVEKISSLLAALENLLRVKL